MSGIQRFYILLFAVVVSAQQQPAQCSFSNITLSSNFNQSLLLCSVINGDIEVGTDLTNFSLPNLVTLNGNLFIRYCPALTVISLPQLQNINGQLIIDNIGVSEIYLAALTSITTSRSVLIQNLNITQSLRLPLLNTVNADQFYISNLPQLTNLNLFSLTKVNGSFVLENFPSTTILNSLTEVGGRLTLSNITGLLNLRKVGPLTKLGGMFDIRNNPNLTSISGPIDGFSSVAAVFIAFNPKLTNLSGLDNLTDSIAITIDENMGLTSIDALSSLKFVSTLKLSNCPLVSDMSPLYLLQQAAQLQFLFMHGLTEIGPFYNLSMGGIAITNCRGLTRIHGAPHNWNSTTRGMIVINNCPLLDTIEGFEQLSSIYDVRISDNSALRNISGFNNFVRTDSIQLMNNPSLLNVNFLRQITFCLDLYLTGNSGSIDLSGLSQMRNVSRTFVLQTDTRTNFEGIFNNLEYAYTFYIQKSPQLTTLAGFQGLKNVGYLKLVSNNELVDVTAMENVLVEKAIILRYNYKLANVSGFGYPKLLDTLLIEQCPVTSLSAVKNLFNVTMEVRLSGVALVDMSDFKQLTQTGQLTLNGLTNLKSVDGLVNLLSIGGLELVNNINLENTRGLCHVRQGGGINVDRNPQLCCSAVLKSMSLAIHNKINSPWIYIGGCKDDSSCSGSSLMSCSCDYPSQRCGLGACSEAAGPSFQCACPVIAEGLICQYVIPEPQACVPSTVDMENQERVEIHGLRFPAEPNVTIDNMTALRLDQYAESTQFAVRAPNTSRANYYANISIVNFQEPHEWSSPKLLLYFADLNFCPAGRLLRNGACVDCPDGALCPGGPRMWPRRGWWSEDELSDPQRCRLPQSCPGSIGEVVPTIILITGAHQTRICAEGYDGIACGSCAHAYALGAFGECISCGLTADERYGVTTVVITAVVLAAVLSACVAIFDEERMALAATGLMGLQRAVTTGQICASHYGSATISDIFAQLSFFNFDLQFVKPGCTVSRLSYDDVFWGTIVVCLISAILFVFASFLRAFFIPEKTMIKARTEEEAQDAAFEREFNPDYVGFNASELNSPEESGANTPSNHTPPRISSIELETKSISTNHLHHTSRRDTEMSENKYPLPSLTPQQTSEGSGGEGEDDNVEIVTLNPPPMIRKRSTAARKDSNADDQPYFGGSGNSNINPNLLNNKHSGSSSNMRTRSGSNADGNRPRSGSSAGENNSSSSSSSSGSNSRGSPNRVRTRSSSNAGDRGRQLEELARREADHDPNDAVFDTSDAQGGPPPPPPPPPPHPVLHSPSHSASLLDAQSSKSMQTEGLPHTTSVIGQRKRKHAYTRKALFKRRAVHSLIILGSILHFQLCLKTMQGLVCDHSGDAFYLRAELQTPCYSGEHAGTMAFIVLLLLGYCIGFPIWCALQLKKVAGGANELKNKAKIQRFGFLYRDLRPEFYWFRHSAFVVNFLLALFAVAVYIGPAQTFWTSLVMMIYTLAIVFLLPFENWKNCVPLILSSLSLIQFMVVLVIDARGEGRSDAYMIAFVVLAMISCILGFVFRRHRAYFMERFAKLPRVC